MQLDIACKLEPVAFQTPLASHGAPRQARKRGVELGLCSGARAGFSQGDCNSAGVSAWFCPQSCQRETEPQQ